MANLIGIDDRIFDVENYLDYDVSDFYYGKCWLCCIESDDISPRTGLCLVCLVNFVRSRRDGERGIIFSPSQERESRLLNSLDFCKSCHGDFIAKTKNQTYCSNLCVTTSMRKSHYKKKLSPRLRYEILVRDGFKCKYCGRSANDCILHVDHIIPVLSGGKTEPDNIITSCSLCNLGKSSMYLDNKDIKTIKKMTEVTNNVTTEDVDK